MQLELDLLLTEDYAIDAGDNFTRHTTAIGKADVALVQLVKGPDAIAPTTPVATITAAIATYTTYADGAVTWGTATRTDDGNLEYQGEAPEFRPSDAVAPNVIKALAFFNAGKTKVYGVANFPGDGVPMNDALDAIKITLALRPLGNSKVYVRT